MFDKIKKFFSEVISELKKVSWPSRKETINSTFVVIVLIFILGIYLAVIDSVLASIIHRVLR